MADCKNMDCPWRSNATSNPYHCDIFTCQRRDDETVVVASNHTLTKDELIALRRAGMGVYMDTRAHAAHHGTGDKEEPL